MSKTGTEASHAERKRSRLSAERDISPWVAAPQEQLDCHFFWLPVSGFPLTLHEKTWLAEFLQRLEAALKKSHGLRGEIFLEHGLLSPALRGPLLRHLEAQPRVIGLGRASDTDPVQALTDERAETILKENRAVEPEDLSGKLLLWFPRKQARLLRLAGSAAARADATSQMVGFGTTIELFGRTPYENVAARGKKLYLPTIKDPRFLREDFYLPLLDRQSLRAARTPVELASWLCGVEVYVRESPEDEGVLIISRKALAPVLEKTQDLIRRM